MRLFRLHICFSYHFEVFSDRMGTGVIMCRVPESCLIIVSRPPGIYGYNLRSKEPLNLARMSVSPPIGQKREIDVSLEQTCSR